MATGLLRPEATLAIQARRDVAPGGAVASLDQNLDVALVFPLHTADREGLLYDAKVEYAVDDESSEGTLSVKMYNIDRSVIDNIKSDAYVRLDAGYADGEPSASRTIFYGKLVHALPIRQGGEVSWEITATGAPKDLLSVRIPLSVSTETNAATLINRLMAGIGLTVRVMEPSLAGGPDLFAHPDWPPGAEVFLEYHAEDSVINEVTRILNIVSDRTGVPFGFLTSISDPFSFDIIDMSKSQTYEQLDIDLDSPAVYSAGPTVNSDAQPLAALPEDSPDGVQATVELLNKVSGFRMAMAFDPRIVLGMYVKFSGTAEGRGAFRVDSIRHDLGNDWMTNIEGQFLGGDFLVA